MAVWEGISEFVAVAETQSFTGAANKLRMSTAQVSRQISALEDRLSVKLFYRTTRKVTITEAGEIYYNHCRHVLDGLLEAERAISDLNQTPRGQLKLTAPVTFGEHWVAPLINDFKAQYPDIHIHLTLSNQVFDLVTEGYDLAIRLGQLDDSSMIAKRLASRTLILCAAPAYLATHGTPHSLSELKQHNCLQGTLDVWRFQNNGKPQSIRVNGTLHCNSGWALADAAVKGIGIAQLPDYYLAPHLRTGRLVSILDQHRIADDGIWAIYPQNRHLSSKIRLLIDFLTNRLKETPAPGGKEISGHP